MDSRLLSEVRWVSRLFRPVRPLFFSEEKLSITRNILIKRLSDDVELPAAAHEGDAGYDVHALEPVYIAPGETAKVPTGLAVQLPSDIAMLVMSRSGLAAKHGVFIPNGPGLVDSGYRGEVGVLLHNSSLETVFFDAGDRIAQLMFVPFYVANFVEVDELDESERGEGGFGSSGV